MSQQSAGVLGPPAGRIARTAGVLVAISALTKSVNLLREAIAAALFGASAVRDAFLVAWTIPNMASLLVTEGLSQVLIATVMGDLGKGRQQEAWRTVSTLFNLLSLAMIALSLMLIVAAPAMVTFLAPNFGAEGRLLAIDLSRVMGFCVLFLGVANFSTGVLNAQQRFVWPALSPIILSGVAIALMLLGWQTMGIYSLALGMLVDTGTARIVAAVENFLKDPAAYAGIAGARNLYGNGQASQRIVRSIAKNWGREWPN